MSLLTIRDSRLKSRQIGGFTLVELLTVLAVVTLLAAIVLPSVKSLLLDRKTSQSAIVVKNYLEAARARAIGKNRAVAVVLERLSSRPMDQDENGVINLADTVTDPNTGFPRFVSATSASFLGTNRTLQAPDANFIPYNTCIKLSLAEEPMAVTHKTIAAAVNIQAQAVSALPTTDYVGSEQLQDADQSVWEVKTTPEERTFSVTLTSVIDGNVFNLLGDYLVAGNEISFGDSSQRFTIASPTYSQTHKNYEIRDATGRIWFSIYNERGGISLNEQALRPYSNIRLPLDTTVPTSFRIYQKPKPIYSQTVDLPKGSCIDLSLSGFANNKPGVSGSRGVGDYRVRFSSDWVIAGANGIPTPEELRPVYLVFAPDGSFSRVYANEPVSTAMSGQTVRIDAVDDVFLHIGRIDQVTLPFNASNVRDKMAALAMEASGVKQNLTDPSTYVIRISPKSGAISAAPIQQFVPGLNDTLFDIIGFSRNGTFSNTATGQ